MNDMVSIESLDLKSSVEDSVNGVFDMMLDMEVDFFSNPDEESTKNIQIVGTVGFAGKATGNISILISEAFSRVITGEMLAMEHDEISVAEIRDVIGELSNMVGGNLKSHLCDVGLTCALTTPVVTTGKDFQIDLINGGLLKHYAFRHSKHVGFVMVSIKAG